MARPQNDASKIARYALGALRRRVRLARLVVALERAALAFWPFASLCLILFAFVRFGGVEAIGTRLTIALLGLSVLYLRSIGRQEARQ